MTRDHVPGRGLFSAPLPSDLLTVPACKPCNGRYELEDEYFRLHVASRMESRSHPEAPQAGERAFRGLERPESAGFRQSVIDSIVSLKQLDSPDDEGMAGVFMVDYSRLERYCVRTITALLAHHWRVRLADEYEVAAFCGDRPRFATKEGQAWWRRMLRVIGSAQRHSSAREVLRYRYCPFLPDGISSIWELSFFSYTTFIGAVIPKGSRV